MVRTKNQKSGEKSAPAAKSQRGKRSQRVTKEEKQAIQSGRGKLTPAYRLFWRSCGLLWHWRGVLGGILVVYAVLDLLLVGGAGVASLQSAKSTLSQVAHGQVNRLTGSVTLFAFLASSTSGSASSAAAGAYQTMLLLLVSVVFIWALRQVYGGHDVRVRDAFYTGTYSIVPFVLVLLVIGLQLLPLAAGGALYSLAVGGGITVGAAEQMVALAVFFLLAFWSLYMLCSSVLALYIVTLPDMTPLKALRSARELVRFRRWIILRKLLFLPLALFALAAVIVIPFAYVAAPFAALLFFVLTVLAVGVVHGYLYALYRELL